MPMNLRIRKVWELLDGFKDERELRGWKTSGPEDWVTTDGEKHHACRMNLESSGKWIHSKHVKVHEHI